MERSPQIKTLRLTDANLEKDVMSGDVFLAGTKQDDGTVTANDTLRLVGANLINAIPFHGNILLPYEGLKTLSWCEPKNAISGGYPIPVFPCHGTGEITVTLSHTFL